MWRILLQHCGKTTCTGSWSCLSNRFGLKSYKYLHDSTLHFQPRIARQESVALYGTWFYNGWSSHANLNFNSNKVLLQKTDQFSTQSSDSGHVNNPDSTKRRKELSEKSSDSDAGSNLEIDQVNETEQTESPVDVDAEMLRYDYEEFGFDSSGDQPAVREKTQKIPSFPLIRGTTGVYDLEELCTLLRNDNARDICVIHVPPEFKYVDYIVLATGLSTRHLKAMAEFIKWTYKRKRADTDPASVKIEGELTEDWFALDLGNIAVHLMLAKIRRTYDLEQLWAVGAEFDEHARIQALDQASAAISLEEFSFESDLERFRKLREEEAKQMQQEMRLKKKPKQQRHQKNSASQQTMESVSGWHNVDQVA